LGLVNTITWNDLLFDVSKEIRHLLTGANKLFIFNGKPYYLFKYGIVVLSLVGMSF